MELGEYGGIRLETVRKLADALRVTTTTLMPGDRRSGDAEPDAAGAWEPVHRALGGLMPQPEQAPTVAGVRDAMRGLAPALGSHRYAALTGMVRRCCGGGHDAVAVSAAGQAGCTGVRRPVGGPH
jgi:hypothetical protein